MEKLLKEYETNLKSREIRSWKDFIAQIRLFIKWCSEENIEPLEVTEDEAQDWIISMVEGNPPLNRKTINRKLGIVKGFYRFLERQGAIAQTPFYYQKPLKTGRTLPKSVPNPTDLDLLIKNFSIFSQSDRMLKTMIEILYGSGLRISEVVALRLEDIHGESQTLTIHEKKTGKVREAPATYASIQAIRTYLDDIRPRIMNASELSETFLFPQQGDTTIRCKMNRRLKRECMRLGLPVLTSHSFRHAAATHMLKAGAGIRLVQSFLAHENIASTEVYTHLVKEDLKDLIHNLHPREQRRAL